MLDLSRLRAPTDFADSFAVLGEVGLIEDDLVRRPQDVARSRNLLVPGYARVDDALVLRALRHELDDLDAFRTRIAAGASG